MIKKLILIIFLLANNILLKAQNNFFFNIDNGISTMYFTMPSTIGQFFPEPKYLGNRIHWDNSLNYSKNIGLSYQANSLTLFNEPNYSLCIVGNLSHRVYSDKLNLIVVSADIFLPKKNTSNKLNFNYGRCSTGLNFIINDSIPNLPVEPEPTPVDANQMLVKVIYTGIDAFTPARTRMLIFRNCNVNGVQVKGYIEKFVMEFNGNSSWTTFSSTNNIIDFTQVDLESVALHELGHTHLLNHTNNKFPSTTSLNGNLMYWQDVYFTRVIDSWSLEGGNYVMSISTVTTPNVDSSCLNPMEAVPSLHCQIITDTKEELKNENLITVFPNPSSHNLNIQLLESETVNFYLYNSVGQLIREEQFVGTFYNININHLPSGIYFLNILINNELKTYKVVKQ